MSQFIFTNQAISMLLFSRFSHEKKILLSGHFVYNDLHVSKYLRGSCFRLRLPLAIALAAGHHQVKLYRRLFWILRRYAHFAPRP